MWQLFLLTGQDAGDSSAAAVISQADDDVTGVYMCPFGAH